MRALATIRIIDSINPIENADAIDVAAIGGWNVVVKKGDFKVGDLVVYFEIDSWIPTELAPFLSKGKEPREFEGVKGERLRTVKLRGQVSQGLILPINGINTPVEWDGLLVSFDNIAWTEDADVTEVLNVKKYEKPVNAQLAGIARGNFPSFIRKTDQERVQNLKRDLAEWAGNITLQFEVTEKADGSSCTIYRNDRLIEDEKDPIGVCSRNLDLKETEGNTFWSVARADGIIDVLERFGHNIAIQGEVVGPGIQGNQYKLSKPTFLVFDIFDIDTQTYYNAVERQEFCEAFNLRHVPVIDIHVLLLGATVESLLTLAEGESKLNESGQSTREGLVFKCLNDPSISFKAISNKWLLKYEE